MRGVRTGRARQAAHRTVSSYAPLSKARRWASTRRCRLRSEVTCGERASERAAGVAEWVAAGRQAGACQQQCGGGQSGLTGPTLPSTLTRRRRSRCSSASPRSCCCCSAGSASISAHICGGSRGRVQARAVEEEEEVQAGAHSAASRRQPLAPFCSACQTWGRCSCWQLNRLRVFSKCRRRRSPLAVPSVRPRRRWWGCQGQPCRGLGAPGWDLARSQAAGQQCARCQRPVGKSGRAGGGGTAGSGG
jgi:hypothetical protein